MEQDTCSRCGNLREECADPEQPWYPQLTLDHAEAAVAVANWMYDEKHKGAQYHDGTFTSWVQERSSTHPFHARDGVHIWVSKYDLTPESDFI